MHLQASAAPGRVPQSFVPSNEAAGSAGAQELCRRLLTDEPGTARRDAQRYLLECHGDVPDLRPASGVELFRMAGEARPGFEVLGRVELSALAAYVTFQNAPSGLLSGCVLQNMANASNSHEEIAALAHRVHAWHVGGGRLADNHSFLYRRLLEALGHDLPSVCSSRLFDNRLFLPSSWCLTAYRLSLSLFPERYRAEILGAALFELAVPLPPLLASPDVAERISQSPFVLACGGESRLQAIDALQRAIEIRAGDADAALGVSRGFAASRRLFSSWHDELVRRVAAGALSRTSAMVELVRRKGPHAVGYHGRLKLGGKAFDDRIVEDPVKFVNDLARSHWVIPGAPDRSLLLTRLMAFGGPMFGIFAESEIRTIRSWIEALGDEDIACDAPTPAATRRERPPQARTHPRFGGRSCILHPRELFHRLMNQEQHEDVPGDALAFATRWLSRASCGLRRAPDALPFETYSHQNFRHWFENRATEQARSYGGPQTAVTKSREEVIEEAVQVCPMILADGAWLQHWSNAGLAETPIGALLYKIFSDEIGNGDIAHNHPNIYRRLMQQMGVTLHDVRSPQFARDPVFNDAAFEVPAFWLSLSQFPRRFLPETLGLNLAMELSGVGGAYRTARDELSHHGFETVFVDLHNTVDNVSTGHAAMAAEAIELLMDDVMASHDERGVSEHWERIWVGFRSLSPPKSAWKEFFVPPRYRGHLASPSQQRPVS